MNFTTRYMPYFALCCAVLLTSATGCTNETSDSANTQTSQRAEPSPRTENSSQTDERLAAKQAVSPADGREVAMFAGGCFWGMEEILRKVDGVLDTEVGYTGGTIENPTYRDLTSGNSGHAESVRVVFDPARLSYEQLLSQWFFRMHNPTTLNRQGNDIGTQYRSAIFVMSPEQRRIAQAVKKRVDESGQWNAPIVTEIADAGPFTAAEAYHQDYLQKKPDGYTCHYMRDEISF